MWKRVGVVVAILVGVALAGLAPVALGATEKAPGATQATASPVNLNTATVDQLGSLPGVGEVIAKAIVEFRQMNGPFKKLDDLLQVKGIGEKKLEAIRPLVSLE
ncbi:MAG: helix-hairpin-helix domain-containing protein [Proteobacteria bacterium]|nr:helix-hairpin-helix domain-containing protein [Pseudomonadota bacterium]